MAESASPLGSRSGFIDGLLGGRIAGCRLLRMIGRGGMGVVFEGVQETLERPVAVKVIHVATAPERVEQRLLLEARATARLAHPAIVQVFDAGRSGDLAFIVMELVLGQSLGAWLRQTGRLPVRAALEVALGAAQGLSAAHRAGLVHRDVKPDNLLVTPACATKVADFGLTKVTGEAHEITGDGTLLGTPAYMSPEACEGGTIDARSDLYSLGATIFASVAGEPPFRAGNVPGLLLAHVSRPAPRLRERVPEAPPELDALVASLLEKRAQDRPPSAEAVARALLAIIARTGAGDQEPPRMPAAPLLNDGPTEERPRSPEDPGADPRVGGTMEEPLGAVPTLAITRGGRPSLEAAPALSVDELLLRARLFDRRGAHVAAERDLRTVLARRPDHAEARFALACTLARLALADGALAELARAVADGFRSGARIREAEALHALRRDARYVEALEAAEASPRG